MKLKEFLEKVYKTSDVEMPRQLGKAYVCYVASICKVGYPHELGYDFFSDFAIADFVSGVDGVKDTFKLVKETWLDNYKAWTAVAVTMNWLLWLNYDLANNGIEGRSELASLYNDLWDKAQDLFYKKYGKNEEACDYFFKMTD